MRALLFLLLTVLSSLSFLTIPSMGQSEPPAYLIGPNDVLTIHVWKEADLTRDVTVMADGRISFPLIGEIMAQGQTVKGLKEIISEKLKKSSRLLS